MIDNIFYSNITKGISAGNISTSISDHLTHSAIFLNESSNKPIPQKLLKRSSTKTYLTELSNALVKNNGRQNSVNC